MSLTPRERVHAQINHQETDAIPYTIGFEGDVKERLDDHYGSDAWRDLVDPAIRGVTIPSVGLLVDLDHGDTYTDLFGSTWRVDRRPMRLIDPPLKEPTLDGYEFPDADACFEPGWEPRVHQAIEELEGHFLVIGIGFGLFERTWTMRGFTEALMDAAANPGFYDELVEQVANHQLAMLDRLLDLSVDGVMFSDDWGYQDGVLLGPERWRRFVKPRLARLYARVHRADKLVLTHCCGSIDEILPDAIEIGLDVYESVQPEAKNSNPYELKRKYGDRITFWGGLGSQSTIPFGTPDEIRAEVGRLCREMGKGGGYILAPAKGLQPETSTQNAAAVVEAFLEQAGGPAPRHG